MSFIDKGSRSASDEDVCPCPKCGLVDDVMVEWERTDDFDVVRVGCNSCQNYITAPEWSLAYVEWNINAFDEVGNGGDNEREHVNRMLLRKFTMQQELVELDNQIDDYVNTTYMGRCDFKIGDRFETEYWYPGRWEITNIIARYGLNTGQFFEIEAVEILKSGRRGKRPAEFWTNNMGEVQMLDDYVAATRWSMLRVGDSCRINGNIGTITDLDIDRRKASIDVNNATQNITSLSGVEVDKRRL